MAVTAASVSHLKMKCGQCEQIFDNLTLFSEHTCPSDVTEIETSLAWNSTMEKLLVVIYREHLPAFNDPRTIKEELWTNIAEKIQEVANTAVGAADIEAKWNSLVRKYQEMTEGTEGSLMRKDPTIQSLIWHLYKDMDDVLRDQEGKDKDVAKNIFIWNEKLEKLLVTLYKDKVDAFNDPRTKKKILWQRIAEKMLDLGDAQVTAVQVENKWKSVMKKYKTIQDTTEKKPVMVSKPPKNTAWHLYKEMDDMLQDRILSNRLLNSVDEGNQASESFADGESRKRKAVTPGHLMTYLKMARAEDKLERDRNMADIKKMHKERMELMREFIGIFRGWKE